MTNKKTNESRGRPRQFDLEKALTTGQALFHAKGYDAVGLAELTEAIDIRSPSFYAAFGSKAAYFQRILARYEAAATPLDALVDDQRPVAEVLTDLFAAVARAYGANAAARGCLIMETLRAGGHGDVLAMAQSLVDARSEKLRAFIGRSHPHAVQAVDDYVRSALSGLSASARQGWSVERLTSVARAASAGAASLLASATQQNGPAAAQPAEPTEPSPAPDPAFPLK